MSMVNCPNCGGTLKRPFHGGPHNHRNKEAYCEDGCGYREDWEGPHMPPLDPQNAVCPHDCNHKTAALDGLFCGLGKEQYLECRQGTKSHREWQDSQYPQFVYRGESSKTILKPMEMSVKVCELCKEERPVLVRAFVTRRDGPDRKYKEMWACRRCLDKEERS
jgi:hypothetical protein